MELKDILTIINTVAEKETLSSLELEQDGCRLVIRTDKGVTDTALKVENEPKKVVSGAQPVVQPQEQAVQNPQSSILSERILSSPLVGTFYSAPSEGAKPFVSPGDRVNKGQVIGIIEAMKLMNEVESEWDGVVDSVLIGNGQVVEYGQPLFRIIEE